MTEPPSLGVALSGGGHRATAFGLGALLYLVDAGVNRRVTTLTSVSGGSLLNAFIALMGEPFNGDSASVSFEASAASLANLIAGNRRRFVLMARLTLALLIVLVLLWVTVVGTSIFLIVSAAALTALLLLLGPASGGFLLGHWRVWLYLVPVVWGPLMLIAWVLERRAIMIWISAWGFSAQGSAFCWGAAWLVLLLAWGTLLQQRHAVAGVAYGYALAQCFGRPENSSARLENMHGASIRHVLCATEMHAGQHAYFTHDLVYSRGFGLGGPGGLPLRTAVQLSANFPGGFPPRVLRSARFAFQLADPMELRWKFDIRGGGPSHAVPRWMVLADGGVFDNTADAWYLEAEDRHTRLQIELDKILLQELNAWTEKEMASTGLNRIGFEKRYDLAQFHPKFRDPFDRRHKSLLDRLAAFEQMPDRLIIVNAGKPEPWQSLWSVWMPFIGELAGLAKTSSTLYNNGTSARLRDLRVRFAQKAPEGAVVDIEEDPLSRGGEASMRQFEGASRDQVNRSRDAVDFLRDHVKWNESSPDLEVMGRLADENTAVATTLAPLGVEVTARLLYHGYLQAMVTLHVAFGYPLMEPRPALKDFVRLALGNPRLVQPRAVEQTNGS